MICLMKIPNASNEVRKDLPIIHLNISNLKGGGVYNESCRKI